MKYFYFLVLSLFLLVACSTDDTRPDDLVLEIETSETVENEMEEICDNVYVGNLTLKSQADVDEFGQMGYCKIEGSIRITSGTIDNPQITSLSPLSDLEWITGHLEFLSAIELENLEGLENLRRIDGVMFALFNNTLSSISSLSRLIKVDGIQFTRNPMLQSLNGLQNVKINEGGRVILRTNVSLEDVSALNNALPEHLSALTIYGIHSQCNFVPSCSVIQPFSEFNGLSNVKSIDEVFILGFAGDDLSDFSNLESVGKLSLSLCPQIQNLDGLEEVQGTINRVQIGSNANLTNLNGLSGVSNVSSGFSVVYNESLTDFCAFQNSLSSDNPDLGFLVASNAFNPNLDDITSGNCSE
jgi:hypothetical protein